MFFVCQKLLKSTIQSSSPESFQLIQEKNDLNLRGCIAVAFSIASRCFVIANKCVGFGVETQNCRWFDSYLEMRYYTSPNVCYTCL